jgi:hypothetical protein
MFNVNLLISNYVYARERRQYRQEYRQRGSDAGYPALFWCNAAVFACECLFKSVGRSTPPGPALCGDAGLAARSGAVSPDRGRFRMHGITRSLEGV